MLPTSRYVSGISPFVTVFGAMGLSWMDALVQGVLIIAAMSSLNSGLFSTGRVLRSLGMSKEAPAFTTKMSRTGVPWGGIVLTSIVYVAGALLNAVDPAAFENTLEAAALGVLFTWGIIFACQLRFRQLTNRGVIPPSTFPMPGYPYTSIVGLGFLVLVVFGMAISGWQASPYFWHKTDFLVVVIGIPVIALLLTIGWVLAKPKIAASVHGRLKPMWSGDGPTYPLLDPAAGAEGGGDAL
jgi:L-asparagine permease